MFLTVGGQDQVNPQTIGNNVSERYVEDKESPRLPFARTGRAQMEKIAVKRYSRKHLIIAH